MVLKKKMMMIALFSISVAFTSISPADDRARDVPFAVFNR